MADPALGLERSFDPSTYTPIAGGDRPATDRSVRSLAADAREPGPTDLASLLKLAATRQQQGAEAEAEELFRQALAVADRILGPDHPELMLLLTDLTRLYLKKSAYASAEPLLLRLLEMKRSKGEDHPEVATVLASLANVRQALGSHESAEQLWRRVLEIRERTLAPNHFAIATALEHLGDACAARGKISEALAAFQRALSIRETTLGVEHPSLRVSREKIADLQLQGSDDSLDLGASADIAVAPERYRLISGGATPRPTESPSIPFVAPRPVESPSIPFAAPLPERAPAAAPKKPAAVVIHGRFVDAAGVPNQATSLTVPDDSDVDVIEATAPVYSEPVVFRDALESLREEIEKPYAGPTIAERTAALIRPVVARVGKKQAVTGLVAVGIAVAAVGVVTSSHAFGESEKPPTASSAPTAAASNAIIPVQTASLVTTELSTTSEALSATPSKATPSRAHVTEEKSSAVKKAPEKKTTELKPIAIPALSTAVISRLDSAAAKAGNVSAPVADPLLTPAPSPFAGRRSTFGATEATTAPLRARLIGDLPTPRVPSQVADVEGEVRVQFSVDAEGRPVMSTLSVVHSPNQLLTTAVRKVIPTMRFEPARTGGTDPKPIADVVQIGFQFSRQE